jgi:hypothetical protein
MPSPENNLLLRLHKWAWRQDENFLTETLAHLLQYLLEHEPQAAVNLLRSLTEGFFDLRFEEARTVVVRTQVFTTEGTPDLQLSTASKRALVEVKSESDVREDQLSRYRKLLRDSVVPDTRLILLTRAPVDLGELRERPDVHVRWYQVAEWLEQERSRYAFQDVSAYLVDQFLGFLGARNMTMSQVTWQLPSGVRALRTLGTMLYEIASNCGCYTQLYGDRDSLGVYLDTVAGKKPRAYWVGIHYERPEILEFVTNNRPVDKVRAESLGIDGIYEWQWGPGYGWVRRMDLESEDIHFFARSKASQLQLLEKFLKECLATVQRIEIRGTDETDAAAEEPEASDTEPPSPPPA